MTSSALIDGGIFEEFEFTDEQNLTEQYHTWPDIQSGFPQAQLAEHNCKSTKHASSILFVRRTTKELTASLA